MTKCFFAFIMPDNFLNTTGRSEPISHQLLQTNQDPKGTTQHLKWLGGDSFLFAIIQLIGAPNIRTDAAVLGKNSPE